MTTKAERRKLWIELAEKMRQWEKMTDAELLEEAKKGFSVITEATRWECLHMLVMSHTEKMAD